VRATRLGQLIEPWLSRLDREAVSAEAQDEAFFESHRLAADNPRKAAIYDNFRANLEDICRAARNAGAGVALMTVPVNLMDSPPFGSLHRAALTDADRKRWESACETGEQAEAEGRFAKALNNYQAAAALDDHFAELHFREGRCFQALGQFDAARAEFIRALDWDALQFRTDSKINQIVREFGKNRNEPGVNLVDAEKAFSDSELSDHGIIGGRLLHDHVHLNFDGDYQLAQTLAPVVGEVLVAKLGPPASGLLSPEESAARLAFTRVNEGQIEAQMVKTTALAPFTGQLEHSRRQKAAEQRLAERFGDVTWGDDVEKACQMYQSAMKQYPEDWQLPFNLARLLLLKGNCTEAIAQFQAAKRLLPDWVPIRLGLGVALHGAQKDTEAMKELTEAQALEPESEAVKAAIAATRLQSRGAGPRL
jgi:tetratricopeptide (TPR) repeat protein